MRPLLALDFDDVIFPFMETFVPHYNETYDVKFHIDDYWTFEFEKIWGNDIHEAWHRVGLFFHNPPLGVEPLPGSLVGVNKLKDHYRLCIVTARDESLREQTEEWINTHFPDVFEELHLCNSYSLDPNAERRSKIEVIEELGAVGLVDDSLRNISMVAAAGRRACLFGDYAWNVGDLPAGVRRYTDWSTLVEDLVMAA